jgi:uncharacterized FlaG/YvyC family protein
MDPAASPLSPLDPASGGLSGAQRRSDSDLARAMGEESKRREAPNVFERARQALMSQLQLAPAVADVLAVPSPAMSPMAQASVAVQFAMNDRTQQVVVRLIDARTEAVLLEMPSTALAVVAARVGRVVHGSAGKASMR